MPIYIFWWQNSRHYHLMSINYIKITISNESLECLGKDVLRFMKCLETLDIGLFNEHYGIYTV